MNWIGFVLLLSSAVYAADMVRLEHRVFFQAIPVLADIDDTFCLDPAAVRRMITPRRAASSSST